MDIVYVDMDGVLADYDLAAKGKTEEERREKGFFLGLPPIAGAVEAFHKLCEKYDVYILSTAPWSNVHAPSEKRIWVEKHLGEEVCFKRLILSHHKNLLKGDFLIDDRIVNGVDGFEGEHIHFGTKEFPDWLAVLRYLL